MNTPSNKSNTPSLASVLVTMLLLVACGAMVALFLIPNASPWFWPTAGLAACSGILAMLVPLGRKQG